MARVLAVLGVLLIGWGAWAWLSEASHDVVPGGATEAAVRETPPEAPRPAGLAPSGERKRATVDPEIVADLSAEAPPEQPAVQDARPFVAVTVVDEDGRPVPSASVALWTNPMEDLVSTARTDASGTSQVRYLEAAGQYFLHVESPNASLFGDLESDWRPAATTIRLSKPRSVRGIVRDLAGAPVKGAIVVRKEVEPRRATLGDEDSRDTTDAEGRFHIDRLREGRLVLRAAIDDAALAAASPGARATEVSAFAGDQDVNLVLDPGGTLSIRLDDQTALGSVATLTREGDSRNATAIRKSVETGGAVRFLRLPSDQSYVLWARSAEGDRTAYLRDVRAQSSDLLLRLVPGATVSGRVVLPPGVLDASVVATGPGLVLHGEVGADGRYAVRGLPPGTWTITATATQSDGPGLPVEYSGTVNVAAGGIADIALVPK